MALEKIVHKLGENKWIRTSLLTLSTLFVLGGVDCLYKKNFAQTSNKATIESISQEAKSDSTQLQEKAVKIFLDVSKRHQDYVKKEIPFVNYVRGRKQAQVYLMMTTQRTGAGGTEYTLTFTGQQDFKGKDDVLIYVSKKNGSRRSY